jgi:hypothetical protein
MPPPGNPPIDEGGDSFPGAGFKEPSWKTTETYPTQEDWKRFRTDINHSIGLKKMHRFLAGALRHFRCETGMFGRAATQRAQIGCRYPLRQPLDRTRAQGAITIVNQE